jgi:hypothetical protein
MRDVHVFRDTRHEISGPRLLAQLWASLAELASCGDSAPPQHLVEDALLRAGELESLLTDRGLDSAIAMAALADALAAALIAPARPLAIDLCASPVSPSLTLPAWLLASPPEGFAHHAVHPLDFAELAGRLPLFDAPAVVIGLRTIGTTLSAVVAATLRARGIPAPRFTVRPEGRPLDRVVRLGAPALRWIREQAASQASFFVVDEGPGRSGSSLLAAAEALVAAGAPRGRVTLLCTHAPDPEALLAPDAARRLRSFSLHATGPSRVVPEEATLSLPAGAWRKHLFADEHQYPPIWPMLERRKLLSQDRQRLFKYEGLGRWGASALARAQVLHEAGFGPRSEGASHGFLITPWIDGAPLRPESLTTALLHRLSAYCAFRASAFPAEGHHAGDLELMIRKNALVALGRELGPRVDLPLGRPVIADARMMPHEWIAAPGAPPLKMDGLAHGDDHLFPGPVDVAWDLAGAIVEWRMSASARRVFLDGYHRASGDGCESRLPAYLYAYTLFRLAWTIAAGASAPSEEAPRLGAAEQRYRAVLQNLPCPW